LHPRRILILAAALIAWTVAPARAQGFISPFAGFNFGGDSANCVSLTNCSERRLNWGASLGKTNGVFGIEEDIAYAPDFFGKTPGTNNAVLTVMSNLMIVVPAGPIQPYALIGLGLIRSHVESVTSLTLNKNTLGYDIGGGINIFLTHSVGVRGDVRHMHTFQDVTLGLFGNDQLDFWRGSAGLTFRF
jgi:opacity protein-like surface antigen